MERWGIVYCLEVEKSAKVWEKLSLCLKSQEIASDIVQSSGSSGVMNAVKIMANNGYKTIAIVGGDDDLNDAVNALMQLEKELRQTISLAVMPAGLFNDFAHFWHIRKNDFQQAIEIIKQHNIRLVDVGCIHYHKLKNTKNYKRYFVNCVNVGLVATLGALRKDTRTFFSKIYGKDPLSYLLSSLMLGFQRLEYKMRFRVNEDEIRGQVMTVCISNANGYGQTPSAVPYNGLLDVSVVYNTNVTRFVEGLYMLHNKRFLNHHSVQPYRTNKIEFDKANGAPISVDGRLLKDVSGSFDIDIEKEVINFIVP